MTEKICSAPNCGSPVLAKGLCRKHYNRVRRTGELEPPRKNAAKLCAREGCGRLATVHGLCQNHKVRPPRVVAQRACAHCGVDFKPEKASRAIYCSRACKDKAYVVSGRSAASARRYALRSQYGLTVEQIDEMAAGGCEICGTFEWGGRWNRPCVDHDHITGKVRGVLCSECNNGLGKLGDSVERLEAAIRYLKRAA
jgi:hypothetical protein